MNFPWIIQDVYSNWKKNYQWITNYHVQTLINHDSHYRTDSASYIIWCIAENDSKQACSQCVCYEIAPFTWSFSGRTCEWALQLSNLVDSQWRIFPQLSYGLLNCGETFRDVENVSKTEDILQWIGNLTFFRGNKELDGEIEISCRITSWVLKLQI